MYYAAGKVCKALGVSKEVLDKLSKIKGMLPHISSDNIEIYSDIEYKELKRALKEAAEKLAKIYKDSTFSTFSKLEVDLYSQKEAAALLGVSSADLRELNRNGQVVPSKNINHKLYYTEEEFNKASELLGNNGAIDKRLKVDLGDFKTYKISEVSIIAKVSAAKLKIWDECGRLKPIGVTISGANVYSKEQLNYVIEYTKSIKDSLNKTDSHDFETELFSIIDIAGITGVNYDVVRKYVNERYEPVEIRNLTCFYSMQCLRDFYMSKIVGVKPCEQLYSIWQVQKITGYDPYRLALFECEGMIVPYKVDKNKRLYSEEQITWLKKNDCDKIYNSISPEKRNVYTLGEMSKAINISIPQIIKEVVSGRIKPAVYISEHIVLFNKSQVEDIKKHFENVARWYSAADASRIIGLSLKEFKNTVIELNIKPVYVNEYRVSSYYTIEQLEEIAKTKNRDIKYSKEGVLYSTKELCLHTGVKYSRVKKWEADGKIIPCMTEEGVNYYDESSINQIERYKNGLPSDLDYVKDGESSYEYVYTTDKVVELIGMSHRWLYNMVSSGEVVPVVRGNKHYYSMKQVNYLKNKILKGKK